MLRDVGAFLCFPTALDLKPAGVDGIINNWPVGEVRPCPAPDTHPPLLTLGNRAAGKNRGIVERE